MSNIHERLVEAFQIEHKEHIQAVRAMLEDLERRRFDITEFDFVEAHRRVHSLKGAARAVGLRQVESLAHKLETLVTNCQSGKTRVDSTVVSIVKRAFDEIEDRAAALGPGPPSEKALETVDEVERLIGGPFLVATSAGARDITARRAVESETSAVGRRATGDGPVEVGVSWSDETARVNVASLDVVLKRSGEIVAETQRHESIAREMRAIRRNLEALGRELEKATEQALPIGSKETVDGAEIRRDSALTDMFRKMVSQVSHASRSHQDALWRLQKAGNQIYQSVRALRIVPAESVFSSVRKIARDLARQEGKLVEVDLNGLDTLVDRRVLQMLKDPILHLLRNAVSHGIELPDVRAKRGKPTTGYVCFTISVQRNRLHLVLEDDGHGLELDRIVKEAVRLGHLTDGVPASNDFGALTRILVRPSFTTASGVTEIAGRGIGLSIVDKAVRRLQGSFEIRPRPQGGTAALISVPLTVAGSRLLLVKCQEQTYGIPVQWVERLCRVQTADIETIKGEPAIILKNGDAPVPIASLAQLLGHSDVTVSEDGNIISAVILRSDESCLAVAVDTFVAVQDGIIQELDGALSQLELIAGGVILSDGSVSIVVNPVAMISSARGVRGRWQLNTKKEAETRAIPLILVVDDSITTRTLEKSILEAKGFRVRLSVDGIDALEQLRQELADLVVVDIEMPRMDGFGLLHAMKQTERLAEIPVVLVTSRDSPQDRRKGLALGAEAYIVKQSFDQSQLLDVIQQIL